MPQRHDEDFGAHPRDRCRPRSILAPASMAQSKALRPEWLPGGRAQLGARRGDAGSGTRTSATSPRRSSAPSCSSVPAWRSGTAAGTAATTRSPTASSSRRSPRCSARRPSGLSSVVASSYLFDRLVRDRWGAAARWATLWFAVGVVTLLADGQLTFALGVAFGLASLRALQLDRSKLGPRRRRGLRALQPGRRRLPGRGRGGRVACRSTPPPGRDRHLGGGAVPGA